MRKRVLSGIRATNLLHIGNYLGAVKGMLELQNDPAYETLYMVADLHAITTPYDIESLRKNRREVVVDYLAAGLDPQKSVIFMQSDNPYHTELSFYLSSVVTIAKMQHLPTFKEKVKQYPEHSTMALLNYPVLMAADILLYQSHLVPVGIDQEPHIEVAREIARRMNQDYGTHFPEPVRFATAGQYVPSLTGEGKMSKSVEGSYIAISDDLEVIKKRLSSVPTDSGKADKVPSEGGVANLLTLVELFEGKEKREKYEKRYLGEGIRYSIMKEELAKAIYKELEPIQEKRHNLLKDKSYVDGVIESGAKKSIELSLETLTEVKARMGFE